MSGEYLEKIVLLSSAVADADNQTMTHGKKLEILTALNDLIGKQEKSDVIKTQKKIEDLCLRILFQSCPYILVKLVVSVLSQCYSRGSNAALHACVAFLMQLAAANPRDKLDRPIPGREDTSVTVHERCVCFSVGVGIVVSKGPSAAFFVPTILQVAQKLLKLPDPAARESTLRNLKSVIETIGVPGSKVGEDIFSNILYRSIYSERSPQVRIAGAWALAIFCAKSRAVVTANADAIQTLCLKILLTPADQLKLQGFQGSLLVDARHAFGEVLVQLMLAVIGMAEKNSGGNPNSVKSITNFASAVSFLMGLIKKHRSSAGTSHFIFEAISALAVRLVIALGEREEDLLLLARTVINELALVSVSIAGRCLRRILRAGEGDSGVIRIVSETIMPLIRSPTSVPELSLVVALVGLVEAMAIVDSSIGALDGDLGSDLVQLITFSGNSTSVAVNTAFALRALCKVHPHVSFSLVNLLLNHITIQRAELEGAEPSSQHLFVRSIQHFSIGLSSVLCECSADLPQDVAAAVLSTAASLVGSNESDSVLSVTDYQKKSCGFILLIPLVSEASLVSLFALWKDLLGRKHKDAIVAAIAPGTVIQDIGPIMECFQTVLVAIRSLHAFVGRTTNLSPDSTKMILMLLNNVWIVTQSAVPLESSTVNSAPSLSLLVHAIRAELYNTLLNLSDEQLDSIARPFAAYLAGEVSRQDANSVTLFRCPPGALYGSNSTDFFSSDILDLTDPLFETPESAEPDYALAVAVSAELCALAVDKSVPVRDYFASPISMGNLEEFYSFFPAAFGSPFCPLFPYLNSDPLSPLSEQMPHPVTAARLAAIELLPRLLGLVDRSSEEACVNVLASAYQAVEQVSSVDFETETKPDSRVKASCVVAAIAATTVKLFSSERAFGLSDNSARALLSVAASPIGLGAVHPMTRRMAAGMIAAIYSAKPDFRDSIFQCVTDSAVSKTARTRSATALLVANLVQVSPMGSLATMAGNLFKLARELTLPTRACALFGLMSVCGSARAAIVPYMKEIVKILTAHAVADIYPSALSGSLLAGIVASLPSEVGRGVLIWESLRSGLGDMKFQSHTLAILTARFLIAFPSASVEFVIDQIGSCTETNSAVCKAAISALASISLNQKLRISVSFFDVLFSVCDLNPPLRADVDRLLKVLLRSQGSAALAHLLNALTVAGSATVDLDEAEEEEDYEEDAREKKSSQLKISKARKPTTVTTKTLMVKCVKRILKSEEYSAEVSDVDKLVNVAVAAAGDSSLALALEGVKLLTLIIEIFGNKFTQRSLRGEDESDGSPTSEGWEGGPIPILLQFETQILSVLRRGVKSASEIQKRSLICARKMVEKNLSSSPEKVVELILQPLVLVDPCTMPWSSFFVLREAGNAILNGRAQQTSEKEASLVLYTRISAVASLIDLAVREQREDLLNEFRRNSEFIHYYFLRLLIDCATFASGQKTASKNAFSFIESDREYLGDSVRDLLAPAVLNGLAISAKQEWGRIVCPLDCPVKTEVDMSSLYVGTLEWLVAGWLDQGLTCEQMHALVKPVELAVFEMNFDSDFLTVFSTAPRDSGNQTLAHPEMLRLSLELVNEHPAIAEERLDIVWNLASIGMSPDGNDEVGQIVQWLMSRDFFNGNESGTKNLVSNCLFTLVQKQPQTILKLVRDAVTDVEDASKVCPLIDAIVDLFSTAERERIQFVVVLLIPVISRLLLLDSSEVAVASVERLRNEVLGCANEAVMVQFMLKLMTAVADPPFWVIRDFFLPVTVEFLSRDLESSFLLLQPLTTVLGVHKQEAEWAQFVGFVVGLACLEEVEEEPVGKALISCMQISTDVFKAQIAELSSEDKTKVEVIVRKYVPKREVKPVAKSEETEQNGNNPSATAPQIQLKLKFGKV